ncbi:tRNA-splicing endonuclease subunit Sen54 isoform X2 [Corythoichthys intestinalis]|uniref:tRNA-splicing endonuclease subunit Sen54 isoform X2 n=1 Tax=Corythoichthys intestinalis TaxID=161448 RepID=UPI0025A5CB9F|nr:tRNA-splicing endonuclease subunit Sen54 isoform X2 [Corythoichthys intestinalis]XP_061804873.1 tRNA-splicing endonuclease subunit Sen54-like [Nerophis lumbriciformis]
MADQNMDVVKPKFCSELLSPSDLFSARTRSHKIPAVGQKDFYPDDSEEQRQRLEQSLSEHWSLVSEERVERLGNLVKAVWIPDEKVVELESPAGKFWQTMGFSANGKQYLLLEEALYLMECGNVQVFYQDLPLSIQDGFEWFLSSNTISLQQYQVFGHLKRLGYVVHRFDASSETSPYARQLNLPLSKGQNTLKRKRSDSPVATCSKSQQECSVKKKQLEQGPSLPESKPTAEPPAEPPAGMSVGRPWWITNPLAANETKKPTRGRTSRWDGSIVFPDVALARNSPGSFPSPDPSLLPDALTVGSCNIKLWTRKLNQRKVQMSAKDRERERRNKKWNWNVKANKQVQQCRTWAEYDQVMSKRQEKCGRRPQHLWKKKVTPLHDHTQPISTGELLNKISVTKSTNLLEGASSLEPSQEWKICFNVYQPDTVATFKKSKPGKPYARMCVCSFSGPVPDLAAIKQLNFQSGDVQVVFAVVDAGDISFYTFKDFQLPTDVYP